MQKLIHAERLSAMGQLISVNADQQTVFLRVQDTGIGMDAETKSGLFELFFTTRPAGTGLSTCHESFAVLSSPGVGRTFMAKIHPG